MRAHERTYLPHRQGNSFLRLLPGENAHFGVWREHRALHGDGIGMGGDFVRQDEDRILAATDELTRHCEDEVWTRFEHPSNKSVGRLLRDLGPLGDQRRSPVHPKSA